VNKTVSLTAQLANCFWLCMLIHHIQPQLPAERSHTKTSYSLFRVLAYQYFW